MERIFGSITISSWPVFLILSGGSYVFWCIKRYYSEEQPRHSGKMTIVYSMLGIAFMAIGLLQLLNVLNQRWAEAAFWIALCAWPIQEMLLNIVGPSPHPPRTRKVLAAVYGVALILMAALSYLIILDAYRH